MARWVVAAAAADRWACSWFCNLLLLLSLDMLPHSIQIIAVLLPAAWASVVVLILQPLIAKEAYLVPAGKTRGEHVLIQQPSSQ